MVYYCFTNIRLVVATLFCISCAPSESSEPPLVVAQGCFRSVGKEDIPQVLWCHCVQLTCGGPKTLGVRKIKLWCRMNLSPPRSRRWICKNSGMLPNKPQSLNEIPRSFRVWANFPTIPSISNPALALPRAPSPVGSNKGWPSRICAQRSRAALKFSSGRARNSGVGWGKSTGHQPWFNLHKWGLFTLW